MKTKRCKHVRGLAAILAFAMIQVSLLTIILPPVVSHAEEIAAEAEYEAKKAAYREQIQANDVTTDDLLIGSWVSFYSFEKDSWEYQLDQMAAAGLNFNMFPKHFGGGSIDDVRYWMEIEEEYAKRNMVYHMNGPSGMSAETAAILTSMTAKGLKHCVGYHVTDEPFYSKLEATGIAVREYHKRDKTRYPFVNLLPSYASTSALGGSYRQYLERFVEEAGAENIEYLSHDYYPFGESGVGGTVSIFDDMEDMRAVAYENGKLKTHAFIQASAWNGMRMPNIDEMRWQAYAYLTYGFKALSYFNLVCPADNGEGFYKSVINLDGTISDPELFEDFTDLNWELRGLSDVLMNLDAVAVYHTNGDVQYVPADFLLTPAPKATANMAVSYMEAKDGSESYIMLFNKSFVAETTAKFCIDMSAGIEGIEYFDPLTGEYIEMDISDGHLEDSFRKGEGKLYRLKGTATWNVAPNAPSVSLESGYYTGTQTIVVTATNPEDKLYYTLDGSYPTAESIKYEGPITLGKDNQSGFYGFRVVAVRDGKVSEAVSKQYVVDCLAPNASGTKLITQLESSSVEMNGQWEIQGQAISLGGGATADYLNKYVDKTEIYGSVTAMGTFAISSESAKASAAGFVLTNESGDAFIFAGVSAKGEITVLYNGEKINVTSDNSSTVDVSKAFVLRVFRAGTYLRISVVTSKGVHTAEAIYPALVMNEGYVGVNGTKGAQFTAQNVCYAHAEGSYYDLQDTIIRLNAREEVSVPYGTSEEALLETLTKKTRGYFKNGEYENFDIAWDLTDFDATVSGCYTVKGYPVMPEEGAWVNANNLAVNALVHVQASSLSVDFGSLDEWIGKLEAVDLNTLTDESRLSVEQALAAGKSFEKSDKVSQADVDALVNVLKQAEAGIVLVGDTSALLALITEYEAYDLSAVTEESAKAFNTAMQKAKDIVNQRVAQSVIDGAEKELRDAYAALTSNADGTLTSNTDVTSSSGDTSTLDDANKGCQSSISGILMLVCCLAIGYVSVKKKEM